MRVRNPEFGFKAECFICHGIFEKRDECSQCHLFKCPKCGKCGCDLSIETREAIYAVLRTVFGVVSNPDLNIYPDKLLEEQGKK